MSESSANPSSDRSPTAALRVGALAFGPLLALAMYAGVGADALAPAGRATLAVAAWMAAWWLTESVPLAATATLALFPLLTTVAVSASCAFMLPVATPPKAIVFASGQVTIAQMGRAGFVMNLFAIAAITALVSLGACTA